MGHRFSFCYFSVSQSGIHHRKLFDLFGDRLEYPEANKAAQQQLSADSCSEVIDARTNCDTQHSLLAAACDRGRLCTSSSTSPRIECFHF